MDTVENPHDEFAKAWFGKIPVMRNFLQDILPADVSASLDYDSLEAGKDTYLSSSLQESICDLVFHCRTKDGEEGSVYILFEHKSSPAPFCAVQLLRYMAAIWTDALEAGKKQLPFIIPVVFYHGKRKWNGKLLRELFPPDSPFDQYIPKFDFRLYNLSKISEAYLKADPKRNSILIFLQTLLAAAPVEKLAEAFILLQPVLHDGFVLESVKLFVYYLRHTRPDITIERIEQKMTEILPEGESAMKKSIMEEVDDIIFEYAMKRGMTEGITEGMAKGIAEGRAKGMAEGRAEGIRAAARQMLLNLLGTRFATIPEVVSQKLNAIADVDRLNNLAAALFTVDSMGAFEALLDQTAEKSA